MYETQLPGTDVDQSGSTMVLMMFCQACRRRRWSRWMDDDGVIPSFIQFDRRSADRSVLRLIKVL